LPHSVDTQLRTISYICTYSDKHRSYKTFKVGDVLADICDAPSDSSTPSLESSPSTIIHDINCYQ